MKTQIVILQSWLLAISIMILLSGCAEFTVSELEGNQYSIGSYPESFPLWGSVFIPGTGTAFETRRQNLIRKAKQYCDKSGKIAQITSIKAVPPFQEGDSGIEVIFSCFPKSSID